MTKKVGVILSGCGYLDGAEIHESVLTLLALDQKNVEIVCAAPNKSQMHVVDHLMGEPISGETRNVLSEASRICRGKIRALEELELSELDAIILPGGFGAAKNLSNFATEGAAMEVDETLAALIQNAHAEKMPLGFICIAPVIAARLLGSHQVELTIGDDADTAAVVESFGANHHVRKVDEIAIDEANRVVSTPAYMYEPRISEVFTGISALVDQILAFCNSEE